jgi:hypothetical protein
MLKYSRIFLGWCIVVLVVSLLAWGATFSPSYQKCATDSSDHKGYREQSNLHKTVASLTWPIGSRVPEFSHCK